MMSDKLFAAVIDWTEDREPAIMALPVYNVPHFPAYFRFTRKFIARDDRQALQIAGDAKVIKTRT
jgi:hypothetical protein